MYICISNFGRNDSSIVELEYPNVDKCIISTSDFRPSRLTHSNLDLLLAADFVFSADGMDPCGLLLPVLSVNQ